MMMIIFIIVVVIVQLIVRQTQEQQRSTKTTKKPNNKKMVTAAAWVATLVTRASSRYLRTGYCMLQRKIDIDTSVPSVTARTTRFRSITHRGWSQLLELEQFLPAVLFLSLHRPCGTHCRTMWSTWTLWQLLKSDWKLTFFTELCETFLPSSASAFLIMALYKFYHSIVLHSKQ